MSRDAVAPVAVEIESGGVEFDAVASRQGLSHVVQERGLERLVEAEIPRRSHPRLGDAPVVARLDPGLALQRQPGFHLHAGARLADNVPAEVDRLKQIVAEGLSQ